MRPVQVVGGRSPRSARRPATLVAIRSQQVLVDWSAQCMSAMTSTAGPDSARWPRSRASARTSRAPGLPGLVGAAGAPNSQQRASSPALPPGSNAATPGRARSPHEVAEHGGEGANGQALRAEFQAAADQHPRPVPRDRSGELPDQAGLSPLRLAAGQDGRRAAPGRLGQRGLQRGELTDRRPGRARNLCSHTASMPYLSASQKGPAASGRGYA